MSDALSLRVNTIAEFEAFLLHASVCVRNCRGISGLF